MQGSWRQCRARGAKPGASANGCQHAVPTRGEPRSSAGGTRAATAPAVRKRQRHPSARSLRACNAPDVPCARRGPDAALQTVLCCAADGLREAGGHTQEF